MTVTESLLTFTFAATLLAATPGVDTALVLRLRVTAGARPAVFGALGVGAGCLFWGALVALGLGALLTASALAFHAVKLAGALYLFWLGVRLLRGRSEGLTAGMSHVTAPSSQGRRAFLQGLLTNVLNPKVGVFYVTLLPQFVVPGVAPGPFIFALAAIHVGLSVLWFLLLIRLSQPLQQWLGQAHVQRTLDRLTGGIFLLFGLRLMLTERA
jgi:threonine/homoserine/homoserine lactone efflux protein